MRAPDDRRLLPLPQQKVPDYCNLVDSPMDLGTMRENLRQRRYQSREEFLSDMSQIVENSTKYNGERQSKTKYVYELKIGNEVLITCNQNKEDKI